MRLGQRKDIPVHCSQNKTARESNKTARQSNKIGSAFRNCSDLLPQRDNVPLLVSCITQLKNSEKFQEYLCRELKFPEKKISLKLQKRGFLSYGLFRERLGKRKELRKSPGIFRRKTSTHFNGELEYKGKSLANVNICMSHGKTADQGGEQRRVFRKMTFWTPCTRFLFAVQDVGSTINNDQDKSQCCNDSPAKLNQKKP